MIKITHLAVVAALALSCSTGFGQSFIFVQPSSLTPSQAQGTGPIGSSSNIVNFDISSNLGLAPGSVNLGVQNGYVYSDPLNANSSSWTVSDDQETRFTLSGPVDVLAQVSHGRNLGSPQSTNGSQARDGIRTGLTESWQLVSNLDNDYQFGSSPNASGLNGTGNLFVDYIGSAGGFQGNSDEFLFQSDAAASTFTVFSNNTQQLNNNYSIAFAVASVPEPATGTFLTFCAGTFFLRRRRS